MLDPPVILYVVMPRSAPHRPTTDSDTILRDSRHGMPSVIDDQFAIGKFLSTITTAEEESTTATARLEPNARLHSRKMHYCKSMLKDQIERKVCYI